MNNVPDSTTKSRVPKLTLSAIWLAVIGLAVWGMVSAGKAPGVVQPGIQLVPQDNESPAERDQEAALALDRVILDSHFLCPNVIHHFSTEHSPSASHDWLAQVCRVITYHMQ